MAEDALALVNELNWDTFHLVGESMGQPLLFFLLHSEIIKKKGGMISQELALMVPERVLTLTLASTHAGAVLPPVKSGSFSYSFSFRLEDFTKQFGFTEI